MNKTVFSVLVILLIAGVSCITIVPYGSSPATNSNQQPVAYIDAVKPATAAAGETITFNGHGTDADGSIIGYEWRSSLDGVLSTVANFTSSSLSPGIHTISFKVLDNRSQWSADAGSNVTVTPKVAKPVINSFTVTPPNIVAGTAAVLSWSVSGAKTVSIDNGVGPVALSGTTTVSPKATTVYTLTATNEGGSVVAPVSVEVVPAQALGNPVINYFTAQYLGGSSWELRWSVSNATSVIIEPVIGRVGFTGSIIITAPAKQTYRLTATNDWAMSYWQVTVVSP